MKPLVYVIIPNWNGAEDLPGAIDSVLAQSHDNLKLVIVDNGSTDKSRQIIEQYKAKDKRVEAIYRDKNYGYTGGVNPGFELAIKEGAVYAAPFNNDAVADKDWLKYLVDCLEHQPEAGFATCKLLHSDGKTIDSTGDQYSVWGLPYPRGRDEPAGGKYDKQTDIFGASGGASLYRVRMLEQIGLFDDDFFAYYEDIDLSFRAQLAGWRAVYVPQSVVYHQQGKTSGRMGDFTVYQSFKNFPMVVTKNIPKGLRGRIVPRFLLAYGMFFGSAVKKGKFIPAAKGIGTFISLLPKKLRERKQIQNTKRVETAYIDSLLLHDLPPDQRKLIKLRAFWRRLRGKHV